MLYIKRYLNLFFISILFASCQSSVNKPIANEKKLPDSVNLSTIDTTSLRSIRCDSLERRLNQLIESKTFVAKSNIRNGILNDYGQANIVYFYFAETPEDGRCCSFRPYLLRLSEPNNEHSFLLSRIEVVKLGRDSIVVKEFRRED